MSPHVPPQFVQKLDKAEAKDRREWMKRASRPDLVEQMNQELDKVWQRFEEAKRFTSQDPGCGPWEQ